MPHADHHPPASTYRYAASPDSAYRYADASTTYGYTTSAYGYTRTSMSNLGMSQARYPRGAGLLLLGFRRL